MLMTLADVARYDELERYVMLQANYLDALFPRSEAPGSSSGLTGPGNPRKRPRGGSEGHDRSPKLPRLDAAPEAPH